MNALTVCVNYDDLLAITLPAMVRHFERIMVVTDLHDHDTVLVSQSWDNVVAYQTDAFYRDGAVFNKGAAVEEGLDYLGRQGWICCVDADILLPEKMDLSPLEVGTLYGARRRVCPDPTRWQEPWTNWRAINETELGGFLHVFHANDPALVGRRPWYSTNWRHAGGYDSDFEGHWPREKKRRLPFTVLHLGLCRVNWWGRQTKRLDGTEPKSAAEAKRLTEQMKAGRATGDRSHERIHQMKNMEGTIA